MMTSRHASARETIDYCHSCFLEKSPPDFSTHRPVILTVPVGGGHGEVNVGAEESLRGSRDGFMTRAGSGKGHFRERDRPQGTLRATMNFLGGNILVVLPLTRRELTRMTVHNRQSQFLP